MGELLTAEELAARLQVKPDTVRGWARNGMIPAMRITPKVVRYDLDAVIRSLESRTSGRQGGAT